MKIADAAPYERARTRGLFFRSLKKSRIVWSQTARAAGSKSPHRMDRKNTALGGANARNA